MPSKPMTANIIERRIHTGVIDILFPSVFNMKNEAVQNKINTLIEAVVRGMMIKQGSQNPNLAEMAGSFTVELNERGILSIRLENFAIIKMAANGTTIIEAITVDLGTGDVYRFSDLFIRSKPYRIRVNNIIRAQIKRKEIPLIKPFPGVTDNQAFYLTQDSLVVLFQELDFTPHFVGPPEFLIPFLRLRGLINPFGPIGRLTTI